MARGWESKSIESQQEDRAARATPTDEPPVDPRLVAARQTLQLSITRAEADLAASTSPAHRAMLEQALAALRRQLEAM